MHVKWRAVLGSRGKLLGVRKRDVSAIYVTVSVVAGDNSCSGVVSVIIKRKFDFNFDFQVRKI